MVGRELSVREIAKVGYGASHIRGCYFLVFSDCRVGRSAGGTWLGAASVA